MRKNKSPPKAGLFVLGRSPESGRRIWQPRWIRTTECLSQSQVATAWKSFTCGASIYTKRYSQCSRIKGLRIDLHAISAPGSHHLRVCGKCVAAQSKSIRQFAMLTPTGAPIMCCSAQIWVEFRKPGWSSAQSRTSTNMFTCSGAGHGWPALKKCTRALFQQHSCGIPAVRERFCLVGAVLLQAHCAKFPGTLVHLTVRPSMLHDERSSHGCRSWFGNRTMSGVRRRLKFPTGVRDGRTATKR